MNYIKNFRLESTLGTGSNAQVKLAIHKDTGTKVAIKIIDKAHLEEKDSRASLEKRNSYYEIIRPSKYSTFI